MEAADGAVTYLPGAPGPTLSFGVLRKEEPVRPEHRPAPPRPAPPPAVEELALLALEQPEAGWKAEDRAKEVLARQVAGSLADRATMLVDYFSLVL